VRERLQVEQPLRGSVQRTDQVHRDESDQHTPCDRRQPRRETEQYDRQRGCQPDRRQLGGRADGDEQHLAADVAGRDAVDEPHRHTADQHRHGGPGQGGHQMACQPARSRYRTGQRGFGPLTGFLLVRAQDQRDGERCGHHAQHGERHRDELLLQRAGAAHARDDVARRGAVAQLIADAVHHTAHHQAVRAQPHAPHQQRAAVQAPRQPEDVAQRRCGGSGTGAFVEQSGADVARREQSIRHCGERGRHRQMQ
jgi:hypothetical protein